MDQWDDGCGIVRSEKNILVVPIKNGTYRTIDLLAEKYQFFAYYKRAEKAEKMKNDCGEGQNRRSIKKGNAAQTYS